MALTRSMTGMDRSAVRGAAIGVLFMAFFGTLWGGIGIGGLDDWGNPWVPIAVVLIGLLLLAGGIRLMAVAKSLPSRATA